MEKTGSGAQGRRLGLNREISAYLDLATCLLIVAFLFYPSFFASFIDAKFLAAMGFVALLIMLAGRGVLVMLLAVGLEKFGDFAKASKNSSLVAIHLSAERMLYYNFLAFTEGLLWAIPAFLPIYALHWYLLGPARAAQGNTLTLIANDAMAPICNSLLNCHGDSAYLAFTISMFFLASSYFGLFAMKKLGISLGLALVNDSDKLTFSKSQISIEEVSSRLAARQEENEAIGMYLHWIRAYVREEAE